MMYKNTYELMTTDVFMDTCYAYKFYSWENVLNMLFFVNP